VMDIKDIQNLPVNSIADKNSILCMWATFPILPNCIDLVKKWGFDYSTVLFTWIKTNKNTNSWFWGCGNYTRSNAEIVILGKKGSSPPRQSKSISQIIIAPIAQHSKKPNIVRTKIVKLFGNLPRIELFARTKIHGWDTWGNDKKLQNEPLEAFL